MISVCTKGTARYELEFVMIKSRCADAAALLAADKFAYAGFWISNISMQNTSPRCVVESEYFQTQASATKTASWTLFLIEIGAKARTRKNDETPSLIQ